MRRFAMLLLLVLGAITPQIATAQSVPPSPSAVRCRYGDNPGWADPNFDDRSWTVAPNGLWPLPLFYSDGIVWVRLRVPVPADPAARSALRLVHPLSTSASDQVFLDGALVGQSGKLPPAPQAVVLPNFTVLDVADVPVQESFATVALRLWYPPSVRYRGGVDFISAQLASAALLNERQRADRLALILSWLPVLSLNGLLALVGVGLLALWHWSRRRELLWFSLLLLLYPLTELIFTLPALASRPLTFHLESAFIKLGDSITMFVTVEFLWIIFDLRARSLRILLHTAWVVFNAEGLLAAFATSPSSHIVWTIFIEIVAVSVFNLGTLLIDLRFLVTGPNRTIAAAMAVIPVASTLIALRLDPTNLFGIPHLELFNAGYLFAGAFLSVMLVRRALAAWRQGTHLRIEFAAAREVQQRLVPAVVPRIDRFRIEAAYLPAQEVGGDFYQVIPQNDGSALIIIGDVSGKGLRAAMTGILALGALRSLAQEALSPAQVLTRLNAQLTTSSDGGFVTCLCAHSSADGSLTLANAGHLAPYHNGEEIPLEPGLPLGITTDAKYVEFTLSLAPGDRLTFLSDGVVEAQNQQGELFGFDRTRELSTKAADEIARAAQVHGQEDDITVLTLTFAPAGRIE
jgi:phosphoserine phosphatase RsbU/P